MKIINIISMAGILALFPLAYSNAESMKECRINIDLNNDGVIDKVIISPNVIRIYARDIKTNRLRLSHKFVSDASELCKLNQYDIIDRRCEMIFGQDTSSPFALKYNVNHMRYNITHNISTKDKFIIADINKDGLIDFVKILEPTYNDHGSYQHLIYYQGKNISFPEKPDKIVEEKRSSWVSGIYYNISKGGLPEKIEIKYKHYGALLSNTRCLINIYPLDNITQSYKNKPSMRIVSNGIFYENNNFIDINNDGHPDVFIVDIPKRPKSLEETISKILDRRTDIIIKFYLYKDGVKGYPQSPSFTQKINVDILNDFDVSFEKDSTHNYLIITQPHNRKKYVIGPSKTAF